MFDVMATLPDRSVDLVLTSPPFLALRSYLPADHPDKAKEIGSEPTPAEFLDTLLALTAEWGRLLAPHGSIVVELGDTYCGARGYGNPDSQNPAYGDRSVERWEEARVERRFKKADDGWPLDKSLCGIPHLYHLSLAYGRNLLTGEPSPAGQWRVRNVVAWCRPNPPVGALGDKFRPATSYMTIATRARDRWFDLDAVRTTPDRPIAEQAGHVKDKRDGGGSNHGVLGRHLTSNPAGAPPLDWWEVSTEPYAGSHYATWPRKLLERPIKAMCPMQVCTVCGEPRRRIAVTTNAVGKAVGRASWDNGTDGIGAGHSGAISVHANDRSVPDVAERETLGWTDCGHDQWRNGLVLDPFGGSGTTGAVATGLGRDAVLIDLDERNADLAVERIGMFCTVEDTRTIEAAS